MPYSSDAFDYWTGTMIGLLQPATVLDIGPGAGKYGHIAKQQAASGGYPTHVKCVEIDPSYVDQFKLRDIYDEVIVADAIDLIGNPRHRFDLVMIGDCIEHMRKSAAIDLLNFLVYRAGYICVIFPESLVQDDWEGHASEAHISTWSAEDFRGWNTLHKTAELSWAKMHLFLIKGFQPTRMIITG